jgi:hypothetical protein
MSIYHFKFERMSRGKGRNAVACAAYRAGAVIQDVNTGITHDYSRKSGVYGSDILAPDYAPDWAYKTTSLWNQVEKAEKRNDALVATENLVALPVELTPEQNRQLVRDYVRDVHVPAGRIAEIFYHDLESHNPHAHILLSVRELEGDRFKNKPKAWDQKGLIYKLRESWSAHVNRALEAAGHEARVDHRSLKDRGSDRIPQVHLGPKVCKLEKMGVKTEWGDRYREIEAANQQLDELNGQIRQIDEEKRKLDAELRALAANTASVMAITQPDSHALIDPNSKADKDLERTKPRNGAVPVNRSAARSISKPAAKPHATDAPKLPSTPDLSPNALPKSDSLLSQTTGKNVVNPKVVPSQQAPPTVPLSPTKPVTSSDPRNLSHQKQLRQNTNQIMNTWSGSKNNQELNRRLRAAIDSYDNIQSNKNSNDATNPVSAKQERELAGRFYQRELGRELKQQGQSVYRQADRKLAERLARRGYGRAAIRSAILRHSPQLLNIDPGKRIAYVRRITDISYRKATEVKQNERGYGHSPGQPHMQSSPRQSAAPRQGATDREKFQHRSAMIMNDAYNARNATQQDPGMAKVNKALDRAQDALSQQDYAHYRGDVDREYLKETGRQSVKYGREGFNTPDNIITRDREVVAKLYVAGFHTDEINRALSKFSPGCVGQDAQHKANYIRAVMEPVIRDERVQKARQNTDQWKRENGISPKEKRLDKISDLATKVTPQQIEKAQQQRQQQKIQQEQSQQQEQERKKMEEQMLILKMKSQGYDI